MNLHAIVYEAVSILARVMQIDGQAVPVGTTVSITGEVRMNTFNKQLCGMAVFIAGVLMAVVASAGTIPSGWTCTGNCGTSGADGVVTLPPNALTSYQWASTNGGIGGVGGLPTGNLGSETNGTTLATSMFSATAGTDLNFYFNYVTSDGAGFADYAWAALFDSSNNLTALLFTARTVPSGSIVPGQGMPAVNATLTPASVPIIGGAPMWSPLGGSSNTCYDVGCGYTGWINANYTIATAGNYYLKIGVTNWLDTIFDSGLAMSGVTVGGKPIVTPEPTVLGMFGLGVILLGLFVGMRRRMG